MKPFHRISQLHFENNMLVLHIDKKKVCVELAKVSLLLVRASSEQRNHYQISPSGYGIHWPLIDEDLSVDALLGIAHAPSWSQKSA